MKKVIHFILPGFLLLTSLNTKAQTWANGGNTLTANGTLGTTTNFSLLFKSNNKERGRLTNNGLWGFGTTNPDSKVHINSAAGRIPLRVEVNGSTKFLVDTLGGVSIGSSLIPPPNGLFVSGNVGIGTSSPENRLHVFNGSAGAVTGFPFSSLLVENSTHNYINILAPDAAETGILFGNPAGGSADGGIIYNNSATTSGFQFRTGGNITRMALTNTGNLGVGTLSPGLFKEKISHGFFGFDIEDAGTGDDWELVCLDGANLDLFSNGNMKGVFSSVDGSYSASSDERVKANIHAMPAVLDKINQLKPVNYQMKNASDQQLRNGFIAQDVMKIFPSLVTHTVSGERGVDMYTLNYAGFSAIAIKGIQELLPVIKEQKQANEEQKQEIATLKERLAKLETAFASVTASKNALSSEAIINTSLEQNTPNPFTNTTTIRYHIQQGSKGRINIYDEAGKMIKTFDANESGQSELSGSDLTAGTYTYTLTLNGKVAFSKQMLITK